MDRVPSESRAKSESPSMWIDPDANAPHGVLLSDRIQFYCDQVALVHPFNHERLGPASLDLTLGSDCWYADHLENTGESKRTLALDENLVVEPNSIVYVTSAETLNLPFYMVGHFNLKLRLLHEGLLVGTGPQIDPGFSGRLSCPLHNISGSKVSLTCGKTFAVVEFQKTTPFAQSEHWPENFAIADVRARGEALALKGLKDHACLTFPVRSLNREPVKRYVPAGRLVTSSMQGLGRKVEAFERKIDDKIEDFKKNLATINIGAIIALAGIAISFATYFLGVFNAYKSAYDIATQAIERVKATEADRDRLERRVQDLEGKLLVMQGASGRAGQRSTPATPPR